MNPLKNINDLLEYSKVIIDQKEALKASTIFSSFDKIEVMQVLDELEQKVNKRIEEIINTFKDLDDALKL